MATAPVNRVKWYTAKGQQLRRHALQCFERRIDSSAFYLKFEEAAHFYYRAAVAFRAGEKWKEAAQCLVHSASNYVKLKLLHEAALLYSEASEIWLKVDPFEASVALQEAVQLYNQIGNFELAGILQARLAAVEERSQNITASATAYDKAAKLLTGENIPILAEQCLYKAARLKASEGQFVHACRLFELCAQSQLSTNLRRFNAHDPLFCGVLCLLATGDVQVAQAKLLEFDRLDFTFQVSAERQFAQDLLWVLAQTPPDKEDRFADMVYDFDKCVPLDSWTVRLLSIIRGYVDNGLPRRAIDDDDDDDLGSEVPQERRISPGKFDKESVKSG